MSVWVKICGITRVEDAELAVDAGADAIGLNFVPGSPRRVERALAEALVACCRGRIEIVGVIADLGLEEARRLRDELGLDALQLHGDEPPELLAALLPAAFKAVRVGSALDAEDAARFAGERLLVDAKVAGQLGGSGQRVDPEWVRGLARRRRVVLAGGLTPGNVAAAVRAVEPWGVDVASGVESAPGVKAEALVRAFVREARRAGGS
ncbi:MAG: phosphoribosylanthranilate isomerase [Myxococcales bacterium]|nr:phosphoribosylanthranilate isomerase [Myxococcales bacterium]